MKFFLVVAIVVCHLTECAITYINENGSYHKLMNKNVTDKPQTKSAMTTTKPLITKEEIQNIIDNCRYVTGVRDVCPNPNICYCGKNIETLCKQVGIDVNSQFNITATKINTTYDSVHRNISVTECKNLEDYWGQKCRTGLQYYMCTDEVADFCKNLGFNIDWWILGTQTQRPWSTGLTKSTENITYECLAYFNSESLQKCYIKGWHNQITCTNETIKRCKENGIILDYDMWQNWVKFGIAETINIIRNCRYISSVKNVICHKKPWLFICTDKLRKLCGKYDINVNDLVTMIKYQNKTALITNLDTIQTRIVPEDRAECVEFLTVINAGNYCPNSQYYMCSREASMSCNRFGINLDVWQLGSNKSIPYWQQNKTSDYIINECIRFLSNYSEEFCYYNRVYMCTDEAALMCKQHGVIINQSKHIVNKTHIEEIYNATSRESRNITHECFGFLASDQPAECRRGLQYYVCSQEFANICEQYGINVKWWSHFVKTNDTRNPYDVGNRVVNETQHEIPQRYANMIRNIIYYAAKLYNFLSQIFLQDLEEVK